MLFLKQRLFICSASSFVVQGTLKWVPPWCTHTTLLCAPPNVLETPLLRVRQLNISTRESSCFFLFKNFFHPLLNQMCKRNGMPYNKKRVRQQRNASNRFAAISFSFTSYNDITSCTEMCKFINGLLPKLQKPLYMFWSHLHSRWLKKRHYKLKLYTHLGCST